MLIFDHQGGTPSARRATKPWDKLNKRAEMTALGTLRTSLQQAPNVSFQRKSTFAIVANGIE
jgi:hypothetical protein